ncbi:hypothetical protein WCP94_001062 [Bilophila wadsworthia]
MVTHMKNLLGGPEGGGGAPPLPGPLGPVPVLFPTGSD